jgi:hypothetical protein
MSVYKTMYDEAQNHFEEIGKMQLGTDEHTKAVNSANGIVDRLLERDKIASEERKLDIEEQKIEVELAKLASENKNRRATIAVTLLTATAYIAANVWTMVSERDFEKAGCMLTSEAGRTSRRNLLGLLDKILKR